MDNSSAASNRSRMKLTVPDILSAKISGRRLAALTAYDFTMAALLDSAGLDIILIGDTLGCVFQGHETTLPVTLEEVIYHSRCVSRAVKRALVVGDLPFMSYQVSPEQALTSAGRLVKEGGVGAVKLEGGVAVARMIEKIVAADIPVMGHVGLTPQSYHRMGGHKVQGRKHGDRSEAGTRERILEDARAVEEAGAFAIVVEGVPVDLAEELTAELSISTIGIGAGAGCSGQILVINDLLGLNPEFKPRFVKRYAELGSAIQSAVASYVEEVQGGVFPSQEHSFSVKQ